MSWPVRRPPSAGQRCPLGQRSSARSSAALDLGIRPGRRLVHGEKVPHELRIRDNCAAALTAGQVGCTWQDARMPPLSGNVPGPDDLRHPRRQCGRRPIQHLDLDGIRANRTVIFPRGRAGQRLLGRIDPAVPDHACHGRGSGTATRSAFGSIAPPHATRLAPLVVFFHGGGWAQGNVVNYDSLCAEVAAGTGAVVVRRSPDGARGQGAQSGIRLHRRDAASARPRGDVCWTPTRVVVAGDFPLAATPPPSCVRFSATRTRGKPGQALIYPATDHTMSRRPSTSMRTLRSRTKGVSSPSRHYARRQRGRSGRPIVSPPLGRLRRPSAGLRSRPPTRPDPR